MHSDQNKSFYVSKKLTHIIPETTLSSFEADFDEHRNVDQKSHI